MISYKLRLGLSYHFDNGIRRILEGIYQTNRGGDTCKKENLYTTALTFRLLRQQGYSVPQGKQLASNALTEIGKIGKLNSSFTVDDS